MFSTAKPTIFERIPVHVYIALWAIGMLYLEIAIVASAGR